MFSVLWLSALGLPRPRAVCQNPQAAWQHSAQMVVFTRSVAACAVGRRNVRIFWHVKYAASGGRFKASGPLISRSNPSNLRMVLTVCVQHGQAA